MITTLYRIMKYGLQNFWRNRVISVAMVLVMLLSTMMFAGLLLFGAIGTAAVTTVQDKIDISVYFRSTAPEDEILKLKAAIEKLEEVKGVEYVSKDRALEIFRSKHSEEDVITQALNELKENPLRASLNVRATDPTKYGAIAAYIDDDAFREIVDKVSYTENQPVIDRLTRIISVGRQAGFALTLLLAAVAIFVAFNTILLAIYSNREEISIMRLVGASNAFIRGPYIFVGILYGVTAAIASTIIIAPFVSLSTPQILSFIPGLNLWDYFLSNLPSLFGYQLLFAVTIGITSSFIVIRRYLQT